MYRDHIFKWLVSILISTLISSSIFALNPDRQFATSTHTLLQFTHQVKEGKQIKKSEYQKLIAFSQARQKTMRQALASGQAAELYPYLLPKKIVKQLPKTIQPYLEKEVSLEGVLEIRAEVSKTNQNKETLQYLIKANDQYYYLNFIDSIPDTLNTGDRVKINHAYQLTDAKGVNQLVISAKELVVVKANVAIPTAFGPQKMIVMAVNFQDKPSEQPWTLDAIKATVINQVSQMYYESSYNQTTVIGDVVGWYTIAVNSNDCDTNKIATLAAQAATAAGVDLSAYKRRMIVYPNNTACSFAGLGTIGIQGAYSQSWLNGTISLRTSGHELGHNLGLFHAKYLKCPTGSVEESGTTTCSLIEYGDGTDILGGSPSGHFNAFGKDRLGWLNYQVSPPITTVTTSGNYTVDAYETKNNNAKALKILKQTLSNGSSDYYYIEFRRGIGFDAPLSACGTSCDYTNGVVIHRGNSVNGNTSHVLDMTPDGVTSKIALLPGKSYTNPNAANGGVTFTLNSITDTTASVNVKFGTVTPPPPVCERTAHTMTIAPSQTQWVNAGASATYTITIKNNDPTACTASNFYLTTSVPNASLKATLGSQWISLAPGGTADVTLSIASATGMPTGIYSSGVTTTNTTTPGIQASVIANLGINP